MDSAESKLARLLHDFKNPLSSSRMGLLFILEGRAGKTNDKIKELLKSILVKHEDLLEKIQQFEEEYG